MPGAGVTPGSASASMAQASVLGLAVYRSNKYIYAQVIDDVEGRTLAAASSQESDLRSDNLNLAAAAKVGEALPAGQRTPA